MAQDRATPLDPIQNAATRRRLLEALRKKQAALEKNKSQDPYFSYQGKYVAPNYGGMIQNGVDAFMAAKTGGELATAEQEDADARRAMLESVLNDPEAIDTKKLLQLSDAGVDSGTLKLLTPDKGLSKGQLYQSLSNNPAMAKLALVRGDITQEEFDAVSQGINEERAFKQSLKRSVGGGSSGGSRRETDAEWFRRDPEGYSAFKAAGRAPSSGGGSRGGKNKVDPVKQMQDMKDTTIRLRAILDDPQSKDQLFSTTQRIVVPAVMDTGENPSLVERIASQTALGERSPMAGEVHRLATEQSFDVVKQLYPASNSDIKLAQSLQAKVGESRESMERYLKAREAIIRKAESGEYGEPVGSETDDFSGDEEDNIDDILNLYGGR
jgi:hypothetical protein